MRPMDAPPECFVCTESVPTPRRSACKCTDRYVHDACLVRMIEAASIARCPVCLEPYANIQSKLRVVRVRWWSAGVGTCTMALATIMLLGCAINTYTVLTSGRVLSQLDEAVAYAAAVMMTVVAVGLAGLVAHTVVVWGVERLAQTAIEKRLTARVVPTDALPAEVHLPPRFEATEFGALAL